ncbi:MAG: hypothetical protein JWN76_1100 [Chitinophagaceae bacterium]|nr:hypothetical protein [Chitinophagaceae bacterium]
MRLNNVYINTQPSPVCIYIEKDYINSIKDSDEGSKHAFNFKDAIAFPGLINSHDHLDFNLFPQLGKGPYPGYTEWGADVHRSCKKEIENILQIPEELRIQWGIYKNLLCGVTSVINHGKQLKYHNNIIRVDQQSKSIHSAGFDKSWKYRLNNPFTLHKKVNMHIAEGIDKKSADESGSVIKWNLLKKNIIAVHGIGITETEAPKFKALVWCPVSNYGLYNATARVDLLKSKTTILFGTDSTLTGDWNIWNHIVTAKNSELLSDTELFNALTVNAAKAWKINSGLLRPGSFADIVIAKRKHADYYQSFYSLQPEDILLIVAGGKIVLFDNTIETQENKENFSQVWLHGSKKWVKGRLDEIIKNITQNHGISLPVSGTI